MFARDWRMGRRCIIPASGFYEWDSSGQPYYVHAPDAPLIGFAGVWTRDETMQARFGILTRAALPHLAAIHPRMPLTLTPADAQGWMQDAVYPAPPTLNVYPVSRGVNGAGNNQPGLLDALAAAPQGNLFMTG